MAITYKHKCMRCNKNYVTATWKTRYVLCYECQKKELAGAIDDPKMKKFFDIPEEFYTENAFLRSIKLNYLRYGDLSGDQTRAFKKVVQDLKDTKSGKARETKAPGPEPGQKPEPKKKAVKQQSKNKK